MSAPTPAPKPVYIFLDEGGNLDFSPTGSKYFTLTCVAAVRPFAWDVGLGELRYELLESGLSLDRFHATEDKQATRDRVFAVIQQSLSAVRVDSVIVEKAKTYPHVREDKFFYPQMMGYLLRYAVKRLPWTAFSEAIVITDRLPINRKRELVEKAVKETLANMLPPGQRYWVHHHESKSCWGLQVADYFNWAIYRAWENGDRRSLALVESAIKSQFDIFERGETWHYKK